MKHSEAVYNTEVYCRLLYPPHQPTMYQAAAGRGLVSSGADDEAGAFKHGETM